MNIGNIPPSILRAINAQPMQWKIALAEAIDNSFDSGSTSARIVFKGKNSLDIIDDGNGCSDIQEMLTIGRHHRQATTKLGRFGVGLKELACWLWGELVIETVHNRTMRKARVDWERLARQDDWNIPDAEETDAHHSEYGTRISFNRTTRNTPDLAVLADEMGYLFAPAIWLGKQIVIENRNKKIPVIAWKLPELEGDVVRDTFFVNGKQVDLVAGVVALDAVNTRKGFTYIHEHRQLLNSALGSKGKSVSRVCGTVVLGAEWKLGKNKDAIQDSDDQIIALEDAIAYRCEDIFLRAESQSQMLRNSALEDSVTDCLKSFMAGLAQNKDRKARRASRGGKSGAVKPADSARNHKKAEIEQDGNTFSSVSNMGQLRMEWESKADESIGWFDVSGKVIYLNDLHSRLLHHKQAENSDAIADICCTILVSTLISNRESVLLPCVRDCSDLKTALAIVLATQQQSDEHVHA